MLFSADAPARIVYMAVEHENFDYELIVAPDGSIPADQLRRLGVGPGTHLRVVGISAGRSGGSLAGSLSHLGDVSWEDFRRASQLAQDDLSSA